MPYKVYTLTIMILSILISQDWDYSADIAEMKNKDGQEIKQFDGNVIINRDDLELKTDKAIHNVDNNEIYLYGSINMIDNETNINCDELTYYVNNEFCLAYNNVVLIQKDKTIYCDSLYYWDQKDSLKAIGNVKIIQSDQRRRLRAEEMHMFNPNPESQRLYLTKSAEVFNITESRISKDSPIQLFEDEMRGNRMEAIIENDTLKNLNIFGMAIADYHIIRDSLLVGINNVSGDSIMLDFTNNEVNKMKILGGAIGEFVPEEGNSKVDSTVYYNADYIEYMLDIEKSILKKNAQVDYGETMIKSGNIVVDWVTNMLDAEEAYNVYPIVSRGGENPMTGESMRFDLIDKKGVIRKGKTNFDNAFYHGKIIQREEPNIMHVFTSKYTSCELDDPHYYFGSKKMKIIQGDKIIARPLVLYIAELPVARAPFAIFPNKGGGRRTGWIMPTFGHRKSRGHFIQNLGYYWVPNDFSDLKFSMTLYDLQGFTFKSYFRYKKRYTYNGFIKSTLNRDLVATEDIGEIFTDKSREDWELKWSHDHTFSPYERLNIDLTYITANNFYQSDNIGFDLDTRLKQKILSSVNYSKSWPHQKNSLTFYLSESYDLLKFDEPAPPRLNPIFYKTRTIPKINFRHNSTRLFGDGNKWYNKIFGSMSSSATGNHKVGFYAQNYNEYDDGSNNLFPIQEDYFDGPNGQYDEGESFVDTLNEKWDDGEGYTDTGNGVWDDGEDWTDCDTIAGLCEGDVGWDATTMGDGVYTDGEDFVDANPNSQYDEGEPFIDAGNGDGDWDEGEGFADIIGNGVWDDSEFYTDSNDNGVWDEGEPLIDINNNGIWDNREEFTDHKIDTTDYNSGIMHNFSFSYSDKIFKWFSIRPSISLKESWIFRYKEYEIDPDGNFMTDYSYNQSFKRRLSGSLAIQLSTKLYGIIPFPIGRMTSFRHVLSPSVSFSYLPDLSHNSSLFQISPLGTKKDYFSGSLVGSTSQSKLRKYSFTIRNDFQAKYKNKEDNYEKVNFLNWTLRTSYNPDEELGWSDINSNLQARIPNLCNIDISMTHDPYKQEYNGQSYENIDKFEPFPRLTYISASTDIGLNGNRFNYDISSDPVIEEELPDTLDFDEEIELSRSLSPYEPVIESGRVWDTSLRLQYSLRSYNEGPEIKWDKTFWANTNLNVNLSSKWKMTYSARFDLEENEIVSHSIYIFRPLHCWEFSFKWWPSGSRQGFLLNIYVKNPDLRDVKIKSTGGSFFGL